MPETVKMCKVRELAAPHALTLDITWI